MRALITKKNKTFYNNDSVARKRKKRTLTSSSAN